MSAWSAEKRGEKVPLRTEKRGKGRCTSNDSLPCPCKTLTTFPATILACSKAGLAALGAPLSATSPSANTLPPSAAASDAEEGETRREGVTRM